MEEQQQQHQQQQQQIQINTAQPAAAGSKAAAALPPAHGRGKNFKPSSRAANATDATPDVETSPTMPGRTLQGDTPPAAQPAAVVGDAVAVPASSSFSALPPPASPLTAEAKQPSTETVQPATDQRTTIERVPSAEQTVAEGASAPSERPSFDRVPSFERAPPSPSLAMRQHNNFSLSHYYQAKLAGGGILRPGLTNGVPATGPTVGGVPASNAPSSIANAPGMAGAPPHRPIPRARVGSPSTNTNSPLPLSQFHLPSRNGVPAAGPALSTTANGMIPMPVPPNGPAALGLSTPSASSLQPHAPLVLRGGAPVFPGSSGSGVGEGEGFRSDSGAFDPSAPSPLPTMHYPGPMLGHGLSPMPSHMYSYANHPGMHQPLTPLGSYSLTSPFSSHFNSPLPSASAPLAGAQTTPQQPDAAATQPAAATTAAPSVKADPASSPSSGEASEASASAPAPQAAAPASAEPPTGDAAPPAASDAPAASSGGGVSGLASASQAPLSGVLDMSALHSGTASSGNTQPSSGLLANGAANGQPSLAPPLISPLGGAGGLYSSMFQSYPNSPLTQTPLPMYHHAHGLGHGQGHGQADSSAPTPMPYYLQRAGQPGALAQAGLPLHSAMLPPSAPPSTLPLRPPSSGNVVSPVPLQPEWQNFSQLQQLSSLQQQLSQMVQSTESLAKQYDGDAQQQQPQTSGAPLGQLSGGSVGRQISPSAQQQQQLQQQQAPLDGSAAFPLPVHPSPSSLLQHSNTRGYYGPSSGLPQQASPVPMFPSPQPNNLTGGLGVSGLGMGLGAGGALAGANGNVGGSSNEGEYQALQRLQYQLTMQLKQQQEQLHQQAMQIQYQQQQHSIYMQQLQRQQQQQQQQSLFPNSAAAYNGQPLAGSPYAPLPTQQSPGFYPTQPTPSQRPRPYDALMGGRSGMLLGLDDPRMVRQEYKYGPPQDTSPAGGRMPVPSSLDQFAHLGGMDLSRGGSALPSPYQPQRSLGLAPAPETGSPETQERSIRPQVISSQASLVAAATNTARLSYQPEPQQHQQQPSPSSQQQQQQQQRRPPPKSVKQEKAGGTRGPRPNGPSATPPSRHLAARPPDPPPLRMQMPMFLPEPIIIATGAKKTATKFYPCAFAGCSELLKTRFSLKRHMKKHTGEKPHVCPYDSCGKSFPEASTLKRHLRIHTGEKPFKCSFAGCQKAFADATNVKRHEMTHTGEKPYRCLMLNCPRSFSRGSSLRQHMISLHKLAPNDPTLLASVKRGRLMKMKKKRLKAGEILEEEAAKGNGVGAILAQHGIDIDGDGSFSGKKVQRSRKAPPAKKRKTGSSAAGASTPRPSDSSSRPAAARSSARIQSEAHQLKKRKRDDSDPSDEDEEGDEDDDEDECEDEFEYDDTASGGAPMPTQAHEDELDDEDVDGAGESEMDGSSSGEEEEEEDEEEAHSHQYHAASSTVRT